MNIAIALTAARRGAVITNHTEVVQLLKKKIMQGLGAIRSIKPRGSYVFRK